MTQPDSEYVPIDQLLNLTGKGAVVTGGAWGIGLGITRRLAEAGASVLIADMNGEVAEKSAGDLAALGLKVSWQRCDVTQLAEIKNAVNAAVSNFGNLSILVNNAGIPVAGKLVGDVTEDLLDKVLSTNLKGAYLFAQEAVAQMLKQGTGGAIINIGSTSAITPSMAPGQSAYSASKGGLLMVTKAMAKELAPQGIRVNMVAPGAVPHPFMPRPDLPAVPSSPPPGAGAVVDAFARIPMRKTGTPADIANAVLFLAAPQASGFVTGAVLPVDGGFLVG